MTCCLPQARAGAAGAGVLLVAARLSKCPARGHRTGEPALNFQKTAAEYIHVSELHPAPSGSWLEGFYSVSFF